MDPTLLGVVLALAGAFCVAGGVFDWDSFMSGRGARSVVGIIGRPGARVFYVLFGAAIGGVGLAIALGLLQMNQTQG
jgi:hypothetical protein